MRCGGRYLPVTAEEYRDALRRWASGVSIVTAPIEGGLRAITVSSFTSLSLDPPLILICIETRSRAHAAIVAAGCFAVNVLHVGQEELSDRAAGRLGPQTDALPGVAHRRVVTGAPVLEEALFWLDCSLTARYPGGDHSIFVGLVEAAGGNGGSPLLWHDRGYRSLKR